MCHHSFGPFQFGPNVNFIVGHNGSKSFPFTWLYLDVVMSDILIGYSFLFPIETLAGHFISYSMLVWGWTFSHLWSMLTWVAAGPWYESLITPHSKGAFGLYKLFEYLELTVMFKKPNWEDLGFLSSCVILLEAAFWRWVHCGHTRIGMVSDKTRVAWGV